MRHPTEWQLLFQFNDACASNVMADEKTLFMAGRCAFPANCMALSSKQHILDEIEYLPELYELELEAKERDEEK